MINKSKINIFLCTVICLTIIISMFIRFIYSDGGYIAFFYDDFFYYLKIAENIYYYGCSSFNNIVQTNGYHPLWMVILVVLLKFFKGANIYFFFAVSLLISLSNISIFYILIKIFKYFIDSTTITIMLSGYLTFFSLLMSKGGMEVHITIFMMLFLIYYLIININNLDKNMIFVNLGLFASILFLSRVDSAIFIAIFLLSSIFINYQTIRNSLKRLLFFSAGGVLVPAYLIYNYIAFDTLVPISGQAKQLKYTLWPSTQGIVSIINFVTRVPEGLLFIFPMIIITIIAFVLITVKYKNFSKARETNILITGIFFPFVFITVQSIISDWPPWIWYYYPLVISCSSAIIIIYLYITQITYFGNKKIFVSVLLISILLYSFYSTYRNNIRFNPAKNSIYAAALKITEKFKNNKTDIFAMGDRAGTVGYLLKSPLIQLEGVVMDKKFLQLIKNEKNLIDVLKNYNVSYYIATNPKFTTDGCYEFREPRNAGSHSFSMRGFLCQNPFYEFWTGNYHTAVFEIK